ncbi:hypothetical protein Tco_0365006 [Tanacetum coccineum]
MPPVSPAQLLWSLITLHVLGLPLILRKTFLGEGSCLLLGFDVHGVEASMILEGVNVFLEGIVCVCNRDQISSSSPVGDRNVLLVTGLASLHRTSEKLNDATVKPFLYSIHGSDAIERLDGNELLLLLGSVLRILSGSSKVYGCYISRDMIEKSMEVFMDDFLGFSDCPDCEDSRALVLFFSSHKSFTSSASFWDQETDIQEKDKKKAKNDQTKHGIEKTKPKSVKVLLVFM